MTQLSKNILPPPEKNYLFDLPGILENVLIYGLYPVMISQPNDEIYLKNLVESE